MRNDQKTVSGLSFGSALQVAFIVLKLCHMIDWSWWWVLSPTWISIGISILFIVSALIIAAIKK